MVSHYFSIIIPLYNKAEYIERCLLSVRNQSYKNFEVIIINDGSSDGGELLVAGYQNGKTTLLNQLNQGVSLARNLGVNHSKYDFVVILDADDKWEDNYLFELNNLINNYPNAGIYGINFYYSYKNSKITHYNYNWLFNGNTSGIIKDYFKIFAKLGRSPFSNSGSCFPKKIFLEVGGYKPGVRTTEDSDLWCRIALLYDVAFCIKPLGTYYLETPDNTRFIMDFKDFQVSTTLKEYLLKSQVPEKYIHSVNHLIAFQQISLVKRAILTGNRKFAFIKSFDKRLIANYPIQTIVLLMITLFPFRIFLFFRHLLRRFS